MDDLTFGRSKVQSNFFRPRSGKELGHRPDDDVLFTALLVGDH